VKNSNKVNNTKLKDICIKSEQTFLKQLNKFMRERKTPIQRVPHLGFKQSNQSLNRFMTSIKLLPVL
jgi:hypothetical protein